MELLLNNVTISPYILNVNEIVSLLRLLFRCSKWNRKRYGIFWAFLTIVNNVLQPVCLILEVLDFFVQIVFGNSKYSYFLNNMVLYNFIIWLISADNKPNFSNSFLTFSNNSVLFSSNPIPFFFCSNPFFFKKLSSKNWI